MLVDFGLLWSTHTLVYLFEKIGAVCETSIHCCLCFFPVFQVDVGFLGLRLFCQGIYPFVHLWKNGWEWMDTERRDREKGQQEGECSHRGSRWPNPLAAKTSSCRQSLDAKKSQTLKSSVGGHRWVGGREEDGTVGSITKGRKMIQIHSQMIFIVLSWAVFILIPVNLEKLKLNKKVI